MCWKSKIMPNSNPSVCRLRTLTIVLLSLGLLTTLAGCGSTKVMTAQKSIAYKDRIYNISVVREVSGVRQLIVPGATCSRRTMNSRRAWS